MASGSRSISKGAEEAFLHECDPCKYQNIRSEAKTYCTVCTEYLCQRCEQAHKGLRATRDHKILSGTDFPSVSMTTKPNPPVMYCEIHKAMVLNSFCKSHDDVICGTCKITDHRKCVITDIRTKTKQVKINKTFEEAVKSLTDLKIKYEQLKDSRKADKGRAKSELSKCLKDMRKTRKMINETFDKLERKFEKKVRDTEGHLEKDIEGHVNIVEDALIQISDQMKSLDVCRKSKDQDVMFVGMKKANKLKSKYDQVMSTMQQTIFPIDINFRPNDIISDKLQQLDSIGTLESKRQCAVINKRAASLLHMAVVDKREFDVDMGAVFDCTVMKSGHFVLACCHGLVLLDESFKVQSELSKCVSPYGVAAMNEADVMVTQGTHRQLLRVRLFPQMVVLETVEMDRDCWGIDVFGDEIYVACTNYCMFVDEIDEIDVACNDDKGRGEVHVLSIDGVVKRRLGAHYGGPLFIDTNGIQISRDGSKIFVSVPVSDEVICLNQQGRVIYQYSDPDLSNPGGLYVDAEDNLLVCGRNSNNIHMVDRDGRKVKVWMTQQDGMKCPDCVSYRARDGALVIGMAFSAKHVIVYKTELS